MEKPVLEIAPTTGGGSVISTLQDEVGDESAKALSVSGVTDDQLFEKIENHLLEKVKGGDKTAPFLLGQFYYEEGLLDKAVVQFERIADKDYQAKYQLGTMYYDGIGTEKNEQKGFELMMAVAQSASPRAAHLRHHAQYNVGRAYFEGYGVKQSNEEAERWWLLAANDGNPKASVLAQTMLGMLYSRPDFIDLERAFFWHSEACGNGSIESQGILGVMYMEGQGIEKSETDAYDCLKEAAERGNVYAQGRLIELYYKRKLYTKASDLARRVVAYTDPEELAKETGCIEPYIVKGIAYACFYLSRCLALGLGLRKDEIEARKYFLRACDLDPICSHDFHMDVAYGFL